MKANELRIGNLVYDSTGCTTVIESIIPEQKRVRKPIPLTEEWLVRFGGKKNDEEITIPINRHLCISFIDSECQLITDDDFFVMDVYHVHQLQNLYFALTGEELTIK